MAVAISRIRTRQRYKVLPSHFQLDRTAKDLKFCSRTSIWLTTIDVTWNPFRTSALPILRKMWSSASALLSCLGCQRSEVKVLLFSSARTFKDLNLRFHNSALSLLPNPTILSPLLLFLRIPSPAYLPSHPYPTRAFPILHYPRIPSPGLGSPRLLSLASLSLSPPVPYPTLPYPFWLV